MPIAYVNWVRLEKRAASEKKKNICQSENINKSWTQNDNKMQWRPKMRYEIRMYCSIKVKIPQFMILDWMWCFFCQKVGVGSVKFVGISLNLFQNASNYENIWNVLQNGKWISIVNFRCAGVYHMKPHISVQTTVFGICHGINLFKWISEKKKKLCQIQQLWHGNCGKYNRPMAKNRNSHTENREHRIHSEFVVQSQNSDCEKSKSE